MAELSSQSNLASGPLSSLGLYGRRITRSVIGRPVEIAAIEREFSSAQSAMACLSLEGEPGIGKTRLLLAIEELARTKGFIPIAVTADEEISGPLLLARSIFGSPAASEASQESPSKEALQQICDALSSIDEPGLESLSPDRKLMRLFDLAAVALKAMSAKQPIVILIDDMQWVDDDSLRMLRYIVRANASSKILLAFACRQDEVAFANEAVKLLADLERMGVLRRLKLSRLSQLESSEFLQQALGGQINLSSAAVMHAQSEGVPFMLAEQVHAYQDAGLLQQVDGVWTLAKNAERMLPTAVRTLIQRRAARLPEATRTVLANAAVLGRSFSLRDVQEVKKRLKEESSTHSLAESLAPAVAAGLLIQHPDNSPADYTFTHDRIKEYATALLTASRRRAIHEAIVQMLTAGGEPPPGSLPLLAQHALAAGITELGARFSVEAARAALQAHAPEEALRLINLAQPVVFTPRDRVALLLLQDDALDMLRRPSQRLEGLAQLAALVEALEDSHLEMEVMLRRAAALRLSKEYEHASEIARRVRQLASQRNDAKSELAACLELGQAILRTDIGEGYSLVSSASDLDKASEAFECAATLSEKMGDKKWLAAAKRELGIIKVSRLRAWIMADERAQVLAKIQQRVIAGERIEDIFPTLPVAPLFYDASSNFNQALGIYEEIGDRQGSMSTIIAMAYISWGPEIHLSGSAKRIEEIRRLMTRMDSFTKESERALADAQMLYGSHVYSRAKGFPDLAITKGDEAFKAALAIVDRSLEFAAAGGVALTYAEMGDTDEAEQWLGRAAKVGLESPTPLRALKLELWRGIVRASAGDAAGMRQHLEKALQLATNQGRPSARCEVLAQFALQASTLGSVQKNQDLLTLAEQCAREEKGLDALLPGRPPWGTQANAALARIALTRGNLDEAAKAARAVLHSLESTRTEDLHLEVLLPASDALLIAGNDEEKIAMRERLRLNLTVLVRHILDENVRAHWFRGPVGRELTRLAGSLDISTHKADLSTEIARPLSEAEIALLKLLTEGRTNREIAIELKTEEETITKRLTEIYTKIGASSRAQATAVALMGKLV